MGQKTSSIKYVRKLFPPRYHNRPFGFVDDRNFYLIIDKWTKYRLTTYKLKLGVQIDSNLSLDTNNIPDEKTIY